MKENYGKFSPPVMEAVRHFANRCRFLGELLTLPQATITMSGDELSRNTFNIFTSRHPKYKLIQHKRWGAALLPLPDHFDDYLKGSDKQSVRRKRRHSFDSGFRFGKVDPREHIDEMLSITSSMQIRQGFPMPLSFLNTKSLQNWARDKPSIYAIFNREGLLRAYAHTPICGDVFIFSNLLGHAEDLHNGIMYLLVSEVIREMIEHKVQDGIPRWAMYDTFIGGSPGLRYFKERLGFQPYKVRWIWQD